MRRSQLAPSIVGEKGDDHGTRLHNSGKHNRNGSNDATDSQHRAKHFAIGIIVMCLSLFTCFHFFISAAVNKHSVFSTIGNKDEDDNNEILPICWGKNNDIATTRWHSTLVKISSNALVVHSQNRSIVDHNYGRSSLTGTIPKIIRIYNGSIRSDSRYFYDVSSLYPSSKASANNDNNNNNNNDDKRNDKIRENNRTNYDYIKYNNNNLSEQIQDQTLNYCPYISPDAGVCVKESSTLGFRCLPSFLIIGTMKSGTGELMTWLNRHPNLQSGSYRIIITHIIFLLVVVIVVNKSKVELVEI